MGRRAIERQASAIRWRAGIKGGRHEYPIQPSGDNCRRGGDDGHAARRRTGDLLAWLCGGIRGWAGLAKLRRCGRRPLGGGPLRPDLPFGKSTGEGKNTGRSTSVIIRPIPDLVFPGCPAKTSEVATLTSDTHVIKMTTHDYNFIFENGVGAFHKTDDILRL